jgi:protein-S-isoprenylcysteine O-methyltransferase Ste14
MTDTGYGLWWLVGVNTLVFGLFAVSFFHPQSRRDWRAMGAFCSISEEREVRTQFGSAWDHYAAITPRFIPHRRTHARPPATLA